MQVRDFGIVRDLSATSSATVPGQFMGTPAYMSPELWAATSDGEIHFAVHGIEVIKTGLSRCSRVPAV